jgi:hypothetical protein
MFNYQEELQRRTEQFAHYLKLMHDRAHCEASGSCFIIFEERPPGNASGNKELSEKKELAVQLVLHTSVETECIGDTPFEELVTFDLPAEGWRQDDSENRFIQFSFERKWFCLDMPRSTLYRPEAEQILQRRDGFFYLQDRPQFTLYKEDTEGHDPFRKVYVYGDEDSAAKDMAYVFFQVWKFPVDSRFYVTAAAFAKRHAWEKGFRLE